MFFLVAAVSFLAKNITAFLSVESFIEGYMLIASTDDIVTSYLFTFSYSSISFRSVAWTMKMREYFIFPLSSIILIPRYMILENVSVKFILGITNLVGNPPFLLIVLWYLIRSFVYCLQNYPHAWQDPNLEKSNS